MTDWSYAPSKWVPFRDVEVLERVRRIRREDIEKHSNPDFRIRVLSAAAIEEVFVKDIFERIRSSAQDGRRCALILPNPCRSYQHVAKLINQHRVSCRGLFCFAMDEYADQDGRIAPDTWPLGFVYAMRKNFLAEIDEDLRPPAEQFLGPTDANINDYGKIIAEVGGGGGSGGADACYSGPGWTGHLAFIEPDAPEFDLPLEEWRAAGARVVTLSPFTLAQNSLHGCFGKSGDLAAVPPRAATIGPAEVVAAKYRMDMSSITVHGTSTSWQRLIVRLAAHGPVTPHVPTSIHQTLRTDMYISEENARDIEPDWDKDY
jgi:glucosamine-6-phosphate deaminase